jgi:hypothetical protein
MLFFWGVLLAGGAGGFTGMLIADNPAGGPKYTPEMLGQALPMTPRLTALGVFCSGLALGLIFCVGIGFLAASATRRRHRASAGWTAPGSGVAYVQLRVAPPSGTTGRPAGAPTERWRAFAARWPCLASR